jgi:tetratricopeptide (TPR) repeat protein
MSKEEDGIGNAITDYSNALSIKPDYLEALYFRGLAYIDLEEYDLAIQDFSESIRISPDDPDGYFQRGRVYSDLEEYDLAIQDFSESISLAPDSAEVYFQRGFSYYMQESYSQAKYDFNKAIQLNPNHADSYFWRGRVRMDEEKWTDAIADLNRAINLDNYDPYYFLNRGNAKYKNGDTEGAKADYQKTLDLKPDMDKDHFWYKEGCFITTAVCESLAKPDDCPELTAFRNFRDRYLALQPEGAGLIRRYYRTAPGIVAAIETRADRAAIYADIWNDYLCECLRLINAGEFDACARLYVRMVEDLEKAWLPAA